VSRGFIADVRLRTCTGKREKKNRLAKKKNVFGKCGITTASGREGTEGVICQLCVTNSTTTQKDWCWTATNGGGVGVCGLELVRAVGITTTTKTRLDCCWM
jgi:hypothetical protein